MAWSAEERHGALHVPPGLPSSSSPCPPGRAAAGMSRNGFSLGQGKDFMAAMGRKPRWLNNTPGGPCQDSIKANWHALVTHPLCAAASSRQPAPSESKAGRAGCST